MAIDLLVFQSGGLLAAVVAVIMGLIVLFFPSFLRFVVGSYLLFIGLFQLAVHYL